MTNYEKIKNMSIEELARFLCSRGTEGPCRYCYFKDSVSLCDNTKRVYCEWLESEAKK